MTIFNRIKRNFPQLLRFGVVGTVGAAINFLVYFLASEILHLGINISAICAFCVAVSNNYVLNHLWTFRVENECTSVNFRQFTYYFLGNIQGLIINLVVLNFVVIFMGTHYHFWGQAGGILVGMVSNYIFAKKIVFNKRVATNNRSQAPSKNIQLFFNLMLAGFLFACGYHAILGAIGMDWPWNSFLFMPNDRFNDWYNSIAQAASINPYYYVGPALAAYFPVTYVLLKVGVGYSPALSISIYFIISIALLILTISLARTLVSKAHVASNSHCLKDIILLTVGCLISYPVIFALDRGNIDLWISLLCTFFVVTQRSRLELIGLVSLSIAIALKGYPAVFLLLLVSDRKYSSVIFCPLLSLSMTVVTLYFMWDGFCLNLDGFLSNLNSYYRIYVIGGGSLFASSDPYNATRLIYFEIADSWQKIFSPDFVHLPKETVSTSILKIYSLFSAFFAFIAAFFVLAIPAARWKKVTAICLIAILFPNVANDYKLCILFPGLYLLLLGNINSRTERVSFVLFCLLMIPKSYLFVHGKPISMLINPLLLIALAYQVIGDRQNWRQGIQILKSRMLLYTNKDV